MALYTYQAITGVGTAPTFSAPNTVDTIIPDDRGFIVFKNTNAATRTVTVAAPNSVDIAPSVMPDWVWTLAATTGEIWVPCLPIYADSTGIITLTLSATANVTSAAVRR